MGVSLVTAAEPSSMLAALAAEISYAVPSAAVDTVDVAGLSRVLALHSRLRQALARVSADLYASPSVRRAVVLVWTGDEPASARQRSIARAAAEAVHSRSEMVRGRPIGIALLFVDERTPIEALRRRLHSGVRSLPAGVVVVKAGDVCAHGVREAAVTTWL